MFHDIDLCNSGNTSGTVVASPVDLCQDRGRRLQEKKENVHHSSPALPPDQWPRVYVEYSYCNLADDTGHNLTNALKL